MSEIEKPTAEMETSMDRRKQAATSTKVGMESTAKKAQERLRSFADPEVATILSRFFKTGPYSGPGFSGAGIRWIRR